MLLFTAAHAHAAHRHNAGRVAYSGKTSQGPRIHIVGSGSEITLVHFRVTMLCRDGSYLYGNASDFEPTRLKRGGRFSDVQYGKTDVVSWKGRASAKKVVGALRVKDRLKGGVRCDSGSVRFTARRAGR